ncbi:MAG: divalent-cation tolerance protein CutA [Alphaproteobacteria bacterium]|nr:divalent-cation tolerance protein CutA [Alphaproteobacteria bacterium]
MTKDVSDNAVLVYTTFPDITSAKRIGGELVDRGLVACVNIIPAMVSIYRWEGKLEQSDEVVAIFKTREARTEDVVREIEQFHPYDVPAVLTFKADGGSAGYLSWIREMTKGAS